MNVRKSTWYVRIRMGQRDSGPAGKPLHLIDEKTMKPDAVIQAKHSLQIPFRPESTKCPHTRKDSQTRYWEEVNAGGRRRWSIGTAAALFVAKGGVVFPVTGPKLTSLPLQIVKLLLFDSITRLDLASDP